MLFKVKELLDFVGSNSANFNGKWGPVRPMQLTGLGGLKQRIKHAVGVLTGKYDVIDWNDKATVDEMYTATDLPITQPYIATTNQNFDCDRPYRLGEGEVPVLLEGMLIGAATTLSIRDLPGSTFVPVMDSPNLLRAFIDTGTHWVQAEFDKTFNKLYIVSNKPTMVNVRLTKPPKKA